MTQKIWKYKLEVTDIQVTLMPEGAEILTVQIQDGSPHIWALVNIDSKNPRIERRRFEIFGTGEEINSDMGADRKYIGTFQMNDGRLVFHLFEYTGI